MMDKAIVGRDDELEMLQEIYESTEPQFLAVYLCEMKYSDSEFVIDKQYW